jgi:hypothetical protein
MKLNIGCGYNYLPGWLNLDADERSAADRLMPAHDLEIENGAAEEINAAHLVEHLGFFKTKYFLSECWRALAAGGTLKLETPHIEKTFEVFLAGDHQAREAALGWVYGSETSGMNHLYCFPKDLLAELLAEAGFGITRIEEFAAQPFRPALRIAAVKKDGEKPALNAALRRRLLDGGLARFDDELVSAGLESAVRRLVAGGGNSALELEQALISAPAALEYFTLAGENESRQTREAAACARLCAWDLQGRLAAGYAAALEKGLRADAAYAEAVAAGRGLLAAALEGAGEPAGLPHCPDAPAVFTEQTAWAWEFRRKARQRR